MITKDVINFGFFLILKTPYKPKASTDARNGIMKAERWRFGASSVVRAPGRGDKSRSRRTRGVVKGFFCAMATRPSIKRPNRSEEHTSELQSQSNLVCL